MCVPKVVGGGTYAAVETASRSTRWMSSRSRAAMIGASISVGVSASTVFRPLPVMQSTTSSRGPRMAGLAQRERRSDGGAAGRFGEDAGRLREDPDASDELIVADGGGSAVGVAQHTRGRRAVSGIADGDGARDGPGNLWHDSVAARVHELNDRRASCGLGTIEAGDRACDEPCGKKLGESFIEFRHQRPAGHRCDDSRRRAPAELLRNLERDRLGSLAVVAPQIDVQDAPPVLVGNLCAEAIHVVIRPLDSHDSCAAHRCRHELADLEVVRHQHPRRYPGPGCMCGNGVGQIASRRAPHSGDAEGVRRIECRGDDPVLE